VRSLLVTYALNNMRYDRVTYSSGFSQALAGGVCHRPMHAKQKKEQERVRNISYLDHLRHVCSCFHVLHMSTGMQCLRRILETGCSRPCGSVK
jgi:hypothetical protein